MQIDKLTVDRLFHLSTDIFLNLRMTELKGLESSGILKPKLQKADMPGGKTAVRREG